MLNKSEIRLILERLSEEPVVEKSDVFPYKIVRKGFGYSSDPKIGGLQAKLSIMLEAAKK